MKNRIFFFLFSVSILSCSGCYTPAGGSSIPWNEPSTMDGSLSPRVNF